MLSLLNKIAQVMQITEHAAFIHEMPLNNLY